MRLFGDVAAVGEFITVSDLLEIRWRGGDRFLHTASVGFRYDAHHLGLGARVTLPIDEELRETLSPGFAVEMERVF